MDNNSFTVSADEIIRRAKAEGLVVSRSSLAAYANCGIYRPHTERVGLRPWDIPPKLTRYSDWDYIGRRCMYAEEAAEKILAYKRERLERKMKNQRGEK